MIEQQNFFHSLEDDLFAIQSQLDNKVWTIEKLLLATKKKGFPFLVLLLSLPFCQPIQIPGSSTPFGILLLLIGLRMSFGNYIWWPKWILKKSISPQILKKIIQKSLLLIRFFKKFTKPRIMIFCDHPYWLYMHGLFIALLGLYLALPFPIPLSNLLAAWSLFFISLGLIGEDGLFITLGYFIGISSLAALIILIVWFRYWLIQ